MTKGKHVFTRAEAAEILHEYQKNMEAKPVSAGTVYKNVRLLPNGDWQYIGKSYDYTLPPAEEKA